MVRGFVIIIFYIGAFIVILFASAGRLNWGMGWATLGIRTVISLTAFFLADPELVKERSYGGSGIKRWDVALASLSFLFVYPFTLAVAGLDVGRFGWSPAFHWAVQIIALVVFALGNCLTLWAVLNNQYFSTFVRLQRDRGQVVVREGPYRLIRHPGYAGIIAAAFALPIALGSLWALLPAAIGACGFMFRTCLEDRTLSEELMGYKEYARQVRYRLVPGIW
jgi:protein-S-isoprenylcysteine O-methyltransferase Ste14